MTQEQSTRTGLLVIPCYCESTRLPHFLPRLVEKISQTHSNIQVRVVDDGSGAREQECIAHLCRDLQSRAACLLPPLLLPANRGKGGAIRAGWDNPPGRDFAWYGFVDADGACSADEVCRLAAIAGETHEMLIAARVPLLGHVVSRTPLRHFVGRVFSVLVSRALSVRVYDSQCGLKFVPGAVYRTVKDRLTVDDFAFDVDILGAVIEAGFPVREIPIDWHHVEGSKVSLMRDSIRMFRALKDIRRKYRRGKPREHRGPGIAAR